MRFRICPSNHIPTPDPYTYSLPRTYPPGCHLKSFFNVFSDLCDLPQPSRGLCTSSLAHPGGVSGTRGGAATPTESLAKKHIGKQPPARACGGCCCPRSPLFISLPDWGDAAAATTSVTHYKRMKKICRKNCFLWRKTPRSHRGGIQRHCTQGGAVALTDPNLPQKSMKKNHRQAAPSPCLRGGCCCSGGAGR